jgi:hypothetical protein
MHRYILLLNIFFSGTRRKNENASKYFLKYFNNFIFEIMLESSGSSGSSIGEKENLCKNKKKSLSNFSYGYN